MVWVVSSFFSVAFFFVLLMCHSFFFHLSTCICRKSVLFVNFVEFADLQQPQVVPKFACFFFDLRQPQVGNVLTCDSSELSQVGISRPKTRLATEFPAKNPSCDGSFVASRVFGRLAAAASRKKMKN